MIIQLLAIAASLAVLGTLVSLVLQWRARIATERRIEALREIHQISPPTRSYRFPEPLNEKAEAPAVAEPQPAEAQPPVVVVKKAEVASSKPAKTPAAAKPNKPTLAKEKPAKAKAHVVNNKRDNGRRSAMQGYSTPASREFDSSRSFDNPGISAAIYEDSFDVGRSSLSDFAEDVDTRKESSWSSCCDESSQASNDFGGSNCSDSCSSDSSGSCGSSDW